MNSNVGNGCSSVDSNNVSGQIESLVSSLPLEPVQQRKEWHLAIKEDLRYHLIVKVFQAIYPPKDLSGDNTRVRDVLNYARKVERDSFEQANDKDTYFGLLAEKIYKIKKDLEEKKARWLEQSQCNSLTQMVGLNANENLSANKMVADLTNDEMEYENENEDNDI